MPPDPVLTLADLESWSRAEPSLAVLGHPIGHSLSPPMHNAALSALARGEPRYADWRYFRFEVRPEDLPRALALLHAAKFRGVNLTVPHKIIAFDRVARVDEAAVPVGAVNTLLWTEKGWEGFNTDGYGLATALRETLHQELGGTPVVLLGAGGAARGAAVEALARGCAGLWIVNRTEKNREALLAALRPVMGKIPVRKWDGAAGPDAPPAGALVVNATSSGLRPDEPAPLNLAAIPRPAAVFDMIYNPPRTPLLIQAEALGIPAANGLAMLVHQGAKSLEIWTGAPAARTAPSMLAALRP